MTEQRKGQIEGTGLCAVLLWLVVFLVPAAPWILWVWGVGVLIIIGLIWWEW